MITNMAVVNRSRGFTKSEEHLKNLCERSFLSLWSYPNPFRDQGKRKDSSGDGKEICDLLVVFGNDILLFSDKFCEFPNTGDISIDWKRWYKKSIDEPASKILGAEAWIREHPDRIFLDPACTQRLPLSFGQSDTLRFHRIVIALGAGERCRKEMGGSGSLALIPDMSTPLRADKDRIPAKPFYVGSLGGSKGFIHVFDDITLDIVMRELDTIVDFVRYLREKEKFILAGNLLYHCGEEELLALYMMSEIDKGAVLVNRQKGEIISANARRKTKTIPVPNSDIADGGEFYFPALPERGRLTIDEGHWLELINCQKYKAHKRANLISYKWDDFIEMLGKFNLDDRMVKPDKFRLGNGIQSEFIQHEMNLRLWASLSRSQRKHLCLVIRDLYATAVANEQRFRAVRFIDQPDIAYLFLLVPNDGAKTYEEYREIRRTLLQSYCMVFKWKIAHLRHIVGIATECPGMRGASEELMRIDANHWMPEYDNIAANLHEELGLLKDFNWNGFQRMDDSSIDNDKTIRNRRKRERQQHRKRR